MQASDVFFLTNDNKTLSSVYEQNCPAELTVPQGVEKIERRALADAPVNRLVLPDSVTEIDYEAFAGCDALQFVRLPKHLETVEPGAFRGCLSLEKIEMCDTIKALSESMFECCASLVEFPFRNGILELPRNVFSECVSLESATLPPSVAVIRSGAFGYCKSLNTVVLPAGLKLIEDDAFRNCESLAHIRFADDNPAFFVDDDGCLFARRDDGSLTLIKVPVTATQVTIPQTVVQSHSEAFQGCDALEKVYIDCPLVEHPIFVALKTEVVAEIIDTSSEEYLAQKEAEEKAEAAAVSQEEIFDEEDGGIEDSILDDVEAPEEEAAEEQAPAEPSDDLLGDIMGQSGAIPEESAADNSEPSDDLLADILGQNTGSGGETEDEEDEMEKVRIKPEELDDAVARGIQEEDEAAFAARIRDAQAHAHDGEDGEAVEEEPQPTEPQEPRFVYGMQSVSEAFEVVDERALYPDRPDDQLDKHEPNELEDITTLVVVTEKVTEEKTVSPALKEFCLGLARAHELKRVYFFGGLGLDNDEFLFGFGKFAMYRNVVYAALASDEGGLSKEIKNFGEIAELMSPVAPFQNVAAPNALELEKPFKVYVQDSLDGSAAPAVPAVEAEPAAPVEQTVASDEPPAIEAEPAAPTVAAEPDIMVEPTVSAPQNEEAPAQSVRVPGEGFLARALRILGQ